MSSSSQAGDSWISAFCSLVGHEYFAELSEDFIEDDFNLTGLQSQVPMYKEALEMILDVEPETDEYTGDEDEEDEASLNSDDESLHGDGRAAGGGGGGGGHPARMTAAERRHARIQSDYSVIETSAEMLYGLIHQRFITSRQGIQQMLEKYEIGHFGSCPRVYCRGAKVLPVGMSDIPGHDTVKLFCPACLDVYAPPNSRFQAVDGAFFGTTFGCLFFMTFPELDVAGTRVLENGGASTPHTISARPAVSSSSNAANRTVASSSSSSTSHDARKAARAHGVSGGGGSATATNEDVATASINGVAAQNLAPGLGTGNIFEPRIYGFRVSEFAKSGPRMKWLRQKPASLAELDEVAIWEDSHSGIALREGKDNNDDEDEESDGDFDGGDRVSSQSQSQGQGQGRPRTARKVAQLGGKGIEEEEEQEEEEQEEEGNGLLEGGEAMRVDKRNDEDEEEEEEEEQEEEEEDVGEAIDQSSGAGIAATKDQIENPRHKTHAAAAVGSTKKKTTKTATKASRHAANGELG